MSNSAFTKMKNKTKMKLTYSFMSGGYRFGTKLEQQKVNKTKGNNVSRIIQAAQQVS